MNKKILLIPIFILSLSSCGGGGEDSSSSTSGGTSSSSITPPETHEYDFYSDDDMCIGTQPPLKIELSLLTGRNEVPYISLTNLTSVIDYEIGSAKSKIELSVNNEVYTWTNSWSHETMKINAKTSEVEFSDYNGFIARPNKPTFLNTKVEGINYLKVKEGSNKYNIEKKDTKTNVDLTKYHFDIKSVGDQRYIPFIPFLYMLESGANYVFNGNGVFKNDPDLLSKYPEYKAKYLDATTKFNTYSREQAYYTLCLYLDMHYGLRGSVFGDKKADNLIASKGYRDKLIGLDVTAQSFDKAFYSVIKGVLSDGGHTDCSSDSNNMYSPNKIDTAGLPYDERRYNSDVEGSRIKQYRESDTSYYKENKEYLLYKDDSVEHTYIVGFPSFSIKDSIPVNTLEFIKEANNEIKSLGDKIQTVVIDISRNSGGDDLAELFVESWLKGEATQVVRSTVNNVISETTYQADVNGDGLIDANDTIKDKKILIVSSLYTYSNGNVLTAMMQGVNNVYTCGNNTGGGSCNVEAVSTTIGNYFTCSADCEALYKNRTSFETGVTIQDSNKLGAAYPRYVDFKYLVDTFVK